MPVGVSTAPVPVILIEVIPLVLPKQQRSNDEVGEADNEVEVTDDHDGIVDCEPCLTNFSIKDFLCPSSRRSDRFSHADGGGDDRVDGGWQIQWERPLNLDYNDCQITSGYLLERCSTVQDNHASLVPIVYLPSDDPMQLDLIPCAVVAYVHRRHVRRCRTRRSKDTSLLLSPAMVSGSTLVRILSPRPASPWGRQDHDTVRPPVSPTLPPWFRKSVFLRNLSGDEPNDGHKKSDEYCDIIRCYDRKTVDELTLKLTRLATEPIRIGSTSGALRQYRQQQEQLKRIRRQSALRYGKRPCSVSEAGASGRSSSNSHKPSSWWPSLIVHSPHHGDGKTLLVEALLKERLGRSFKTGTNNSTGTTTTCPHIHVIRSGPLLAKYGSRADAALESQIHAALLSAACRSGCCSTSSSDSNDAPMCAILLDQLEVFLPPLMSGKSSSSSSGDAAVPVVNAVASYLRAITSSMHRHGEFPFPVKNVLYNNSVSAGQYQIDNPGQVLTVRLCLVGIVTCPDDGWRSVQRHQVGAGNSALFDSIVGDRFRLPLLTDEGRLAALQSFIATKGLVLDSAASDRLSVLAFSSPWVKAGSFARIVWRLNTILDTKEAKTGCSSTATATAEDLDIAVDAIRRENSGISGSIDTREDRSDRDQSAFMLEAAASPHFATVGGAEKAKAALEDALALDPLKRRMLQRFGLAPPTGVLIYGPPGSGKTLLAKAIARLLGDSESRGVSQSNRLGGKFISLSISDVVSSELGTSEKTLMSTFEYADQNGPAVVFLDEFQALFMDRNSGGSGRLTTTLLQCLDDIHRWQEADDIAQKNTTTTSKLGSARVTVIAATNTPWMIDAAFLRPGRFDRVVQVGLPSSTERESIFLVHASQMRLQGGGGNDDLEQLNSLSRYVANRTDGFSGADLFALCRAAAVRALIENGSDAKVARRHFKEALEEDVVASSDESLVRRLAQWRPGHGT